MPDQTKGPGFEHKTKDSPKPGRTKVFAIAIGTYKHKVYWRKLDYPVSDCIRELNRLVDDAENVQLITASRHVEIQHFNWAREVKKIELQPLSDESVLGYLKRLNAEIPQNQSLFNLLHNPMMLSIYGGTDSIAKKHGQDPSFVFFTVRTEAELLWNFNEAQLAKLLEDNEGRAKEMVFITFLMRYLVPFIAWRVEKEGQFFRIIQYIKNISK